MAPRDPRSRDAAALRASPIGRLRRVTTAPTPPDVEFCGYCGRRATGGTPESRASRICGQCRMGLLLHAQPDVAPAPGDPFLVIDDLLTVRAVSRRAEEILRLSETAAVDRHVGELLVPAETAWGPAATLAAQLAQATRGGEDELPGLAVRPSGTFGVRYWARIGSCRPSPAAVLVLGERL